MSTKNLSVPSVNDLHPFSFLTDSEVDSNTRNERLKKLLLELSKEKSLKKDFGTILREAADKIREKAFGFNRNVTKRKVITLIREFEICEMDDFIEEFKYPKKEILGALEDLIAEGKIITGKRRRWQEAGKHFNPTYELKK